MSGRRVEIRWTDTAKRCLRGLPTKVRKGLLNKADELIASGEPESAHKALLGPLAGHYRITYGRYRAIYRVDKQELPSGDVLLRIVVTFVFAGIRKDGDKKDVYVLAQKLYRLGIIQPIAANPRRTRRK